MSEKELIEHVSYLINQTYNATNQYISNNAFEFIKNNQSKIETLFLECNNNFKKAIFLAGSSGAGKSEVALSLKINENINILDTDNIRKICPSYSGVNSYLFQKASSRGIDILLNSSFKHNYSFILDSNFANYEIQKKNITRAIDRDYSIEIHFIYRPLEIAKEYVLKREQVEGRKVPNNIFYNKFIDSVDTTKRIILEFNLVNCFKFYDLINKCIFYKESAFDNFLKRVKYNYDYAKKNLQSEQHKSHRRKR